MAKTTYTNSDEKQITAYLTLDSANPQDTTIYLTPKTGYGTLHKITWPAVGSKTKPIVLFYDNAGELKEDQDFSDYWLRAGKEALRNAKFNWFERNLGEARKLQPVQEEACGGKVLKGKDGMLTKTAKNIAKKFGLVESRREETEPQIVRNMEVNPYYTRDQYRIEDPTYGRVITSYKVPGLSNDTSWYMRPGAMETVTPGGIIGLTILEPTDGKYILNSWDRIPVDVSQEDNRWIKDEIFVPESEAKKQKYWFSLPHGRNIRYNHNSGYVPGELDYKFKHGGRLMRQGGKIIEVPFE